MNNLAPKRSAQPRQRGPVGRKMWRVGYVFFTTRKAADIFAVSSVPERLLCIALDPANVERIRAELACELIANDGASVGDIVDALLARLNLTPAKRRGK